MQNKIFVLHAGETYIENEVKVEGKEELLGAKEVLPCWSGCFAGSAAVEASGGVVAHGQQLQAARCCFKRQREMLLLFLSPLVFRFSFSSFVVKWFPSLYSLLSCLFLPQTLPPPLSLSLSLLLSFSFHLFFVLVLRAIFIGQRGVGVSLSLRMGSGAFLPCQFLSGAFAAYVSDLCNLTLN
jgi:hypothetical protein